MNKEGTQIFYIENSDIWVMNADGTGNTKLTYTAGRTEYSPKISDDGSKILYTAWESNGRVYMMNADGSNQHLVCPGATTISATTAVWSPDENTIAFAGQDTDDATYGMWMMNNDGSNLTRKKNFGTGPSVMNIRWLPNNIIVFDQISTGGKADIITMDADGNTTNLTNTGAESEYLDFLFWT